MKRWWHANRGTVTLAEIDLRVGGRWRWVLRTTGGEDVAFHGEYREIVPGERLVHTELFEMPGIPEDDATVNTLVFEEHDGRTTLTTTTDCRTPEILQMIVASGMEAGMQDALRPARGARDLARLTRCGVGRIDPTPTRRPVQRPTGASASPASTGPARCGPNGRVPG